jgi:hypothetical protein
MEVRILARRRKKGPGRSKKIPSRIPVSPGETLNYKRYIYYVSGGQGNPAKIYKAIRKGARIGPG